MADIKVLDTTEVYWATTKEFELDVDGEITTVRIAENAKGVEFFEWNEISGWEESDTDDGIMKDVYTAWENGELE